MGVTPEMSSVIQAEPTTHPCAKDYITYGLDLLIPLDLLFDLSSSKMATPGGTAEPNPARPNVFSFVPSGRKALVIF